MLDFPATHRNRQAIASLLNKVWRAQERYQFLEVASGSGQHACYFAKEFPHWVIQPTDLEVQHLQSIDAYREDQGLANLLPAQHLDVSEKCWSVKGSYEAVWSINLIHISPWSCTQALFENARPLLKKHGRLLLYGPFRQDGQHTSPSNAQFDQSLKSRNPAWGVRCLKEVEEVATSLGYFLELVENMPANNLTAVFQLGEPT